jgi:hypothetical protein
MLLHFSGYRILRDAHAFFKKKALVEMGYKVDEVLISLRDTPAE